MPNAQLKEIPEDEEQCANNRCCDEEDMEVLDSSEEESSEDDSVEHMANNTVHTQKTVRQMIRFIEILAMISPCSLQQSPSLDLVVKLSSLTFFYFSCTCCKSFAISLSYSSGNNSKF